MLRLLMDSAGKKNSKKRDEILRVIQSTESHPSAQWVYDKLKPVIQDLSLGTVYRNIGLFLREGDVVSVGVVNGEERFDGKVAPHPHLVCSTCGKIIDLPCPTNFRNLENALRTIASDKGLTGKTVCRIEDSANDKTEGFVVDYRKTVFFGLCTDCTGEKQRTSAYAG
ncbi:MAG: transcriptional repressor [Treponema sp.]|jgi:Fur family peroxide stress response transcriptional regulator|nr:transcriptional repressor [Treponema sp.]